jgi:hypothetical protein
VLPSNVATWLCRTAEHQFSSEQHTRAGSRDACPALVICGCRTALGGHHETSPPHILASGAGAAALPALSRIARAQAYPARPVRIINAFAPGGGSDIIARLLGQWMTERLGQSFILENRPGAGGNIGTEVVVRAVPDGYTLLLVQNPNAINATLYDKLNFNYVRDIVPVGHNPFSVCDGGQSIGSGDDGSGVHRLCQDQSRQGQHGDGGHRIGAPSLW